MMRGGNATLILLCVMGVLSACAALSPKTSLHLTPVFHENLPGWQEDSLKPALAAFLRSCKRFSTLPADRPLEGRGFAGTAGQWKDVCGDAALLPYRDERFIRYFFETRFAPFRVSTWRNDKGLFTGYYEASLHGSRTPTARFIYPVYRLPSDIPKNSPYLTRAEIEAGALSGKGLELLWVDDPVALFFTHIQGSSLVYLNDGTTARIGYAGKNGQPYTAIGKVLVERGELKKEEVSAPAIKRWLHSHKEQAEEVMNTNASYVFFREVTEGGAVGSQGVTLTPGRSLAVDKTLLPLGVPVWLDTELSPADGEAAKPFRRLMVAQDTGGAIRGSVRGDIFFGAGEEAEWKAGHQQSQGGYYILLPIGVIK